MSAPAVERMLARLYSDEVYRRAFVDAPLDVAHRAGLDDDEAQALAAMDRCALALAAQSYAHKRAGRGRLGLLHRIAALLGPSS